MWPQFLMLTRGARKSKIIADNTANATNHLQAVITVREPTLKRAVRTKTGTYLARRVTCCHRETPSSRFLGPKVRCPSAAEFPIMTRELAIDMNPLFEISFAQSDMRATKMIWIADS